MTRNHTEKIVTEVWSIRFSFFAYNNETKNISDKNRHLISRQICRYLFLREEYYQITLSNYSSRSEWGEWEC